MSDDDQQDMDQAAQHEQECNEQRQREEQAIAHARFVEAQFNYWNAKYCEEVKAWNERMRKL